MKKTSITLLLVLSLLVAGCASLGGSADKTTSSTSTMEDSTSTVASTTTASSTDAGDGTTESTTETSTTATTTTRTTTTTTTTTTTEASWSAPTSPNTPFQNKMEEEDGNQIRSVSVVDAKEESGGGYSDFDLKVSADTEMHHIDPAEHGTVNGEPFFLVYVDGSLDNESRFTDASGTLIERSDVSQDENGEFTIDVRSQSLKEAGAEDGEVELMILLMDEDSDWDDIYGVTWVTVDYSSGE